MGEAITASTYGERTWYGCANSGYMLQLSLASDSNRADWQISRAFVPYQIPSSLMGGQHKENFGLGGSHLVKIESREQQLDGWVASS